MTKFRAALEEGKFAARVARQFFRSYRKWRDANPNEDVVYVYVGHPDMAAAIVRQSPLWRQRFGEWEQMQKVQRPYDAMLKQAETYARIPMPNNAQPVEPGRPKLVQCDCAACTASRATREESKAYDA